MPLWNDQITLTADRLPWAGRWPQQATAEALAEAQELVAPQAVYELVAAEPTPSGPRLADGTVLNSPNLAAALGPAGRLILSICTIGPALESRSQEWGTRGDVTRAFLLDALGVVAMQALGSQLERHFDRELASKDLHLGCPHAPGQDDWPLADQRVLFALLQPERIGIRLSTSYLMTPLKSASVAIPVGKQGEVLANGTACAQCERREECPYAQ
jgi:hypothetical protein